MEYNLSNFSSIYFNLFHLNLLLLYTQQHLCQKYMCVVCREYCIKTHKEKLTFFSCLISKAENQIQTFFTDYSFVTIFTDIGPIHQLLFNTDQFLSKFLIQCHIHFINKCIDYFKMGFFKYVLTYGNIHNANGTHCCSTINNLKPSCGKHLVCLRLHFIPIKQQFVLRLF